MKKKEKGMIGKLAPLAVSCMFLGAGLVWMIVGLVIGICSKFDPTVIKPLYWIIGGGLFVLGLGLFIPSFISSRK